MVENIRIPATFNIDKSTTLMIEEIQKKVKNEKNIKLSKSSIVDMAISKLYKSIEKEDVKLV